MGCVPRLIFRALWRNQIITLFLAIPTLIEVYRSPLSERRKWWARRPGQWNMATVVILNGLTWSGSLGFWVIALQYTTTTRASLLSCLYPLFLVIWMRYTGAFRSPAARVRDVPSRSLLPN